MAIFNRTCVQISLDAIEHNYTAIRKVFGPTRVMTVLKGNAYGHGIRGILSACDPHTDTYAVATAEEGAEIRSWGSRKEVLLFGPVPVCQMVQAAAQELTFTVGSLAYAQTLSAQLQAAGLEARCHLKLDTGLNRTGVRWRAATREQALAEVRAIHALPNLHFTGTYSHLACPESPDEDDIRFTQTQFDLFSDALSAMEQQGLTVGLRHCCSTGGALAHPEFRLDMVRLGMMVYGQCDSMEHMEQFGLRQALCWKSQLIQIEPVPAGESISYGRTYRTQRDMVLGVVSCGYADGYRRSYQSFGQVLVGGRRVPVVGRICMDYLLVDLTGIPQPHPGMEVVLLGEQGEGSITAIELAEAVGSVCGEVTGAISARVPRYYTKAGEAV